MNDELTGAIRNALERGFSLEQAIQSLINAGYSPSEVNESSKLFTQSASSVSSNFTVVNSSKAIGKPQQFISEQTEKPIQMSQITQQIQPKAQPPQQVQQVQQIQKKSPNIERQIQQAYPQMASPQVPIRNQVEVDKEKKQTLAILLAIMILVIGIVMLILIFKNEIINLVT